MKIFLNLHTTFLCLNVMICIILMESYFQQHLASGEGTVQFRCKLEEFSPGFLSVFGTPRWEHNTDKP